MKNPLILSVLFSFLSLTSLLAQGGTVPPPPTGPTTQMTFDNDEFEFGMIEQGEKVQHIFRFTNTGSRPLVISNATGSCGCTVPNWPKAPIGPGETGAIVAEFNSKGKMGMQNKTITITANTNPPQTLLHIKGEIYSSESGVDPSVATKLKDANKKSEDQKYQMSVFPNPAKDQISLKIEGATGQSVNLEIYDASGKLVHQQTAKNAGTSPIGINVSSLSNGQYYISVKVGDQERVSLPFVVTK